ncbi:MAG: hypothetical protein IPM54_03435 [Polyangiaceae bacterium]|nr:hypothetical protein [Polyangiaceae bacterium]
MVLATYLVVWRAKYTPHATTPSLIIEGDKADIRKDRLEFLKPYAYDLAARIRLADESLEVALERALMLFWTQWMSRQGLAKYQHPVAMLSERDIKEDFAAIYTQDVGSKKSPANTTANPTNAVANAEVDERAHLQRAGDALAFANSFNGPTGAIPQRAA